MRDSADWMRGSDDRILEAVRDYGTLSPKAIATITGLSHGHVRNRVRVLDRGGLLDRVARGQYTLTDDGAGYLDESFDASELPDPDAE